MKFTGALLTLCLATVVSVNSVAIKRYSDDTTPYPTYPTTLKTTVKTTQRVDPSTSHIDYPTTGKTYHPTDYTPVPSTHKPNPDLTCYGHFTYKEGHNIIVDGKYNRHHDPVECEISCYVSRATFHFTTFHQVLINICFHDV